MSVQLYRAGVKRLQTKVWAGTRKRIHLGLRPRGSPGPEDDWHIWGKINPGVRRAFTDEAPGIFERELFKIVRERLTKLVNRHIAKRS